ncbi:MAG: hypothetical protein HZA72_01290 [Candidatus Omnitrophica bacterium]|nr:hypothetical protein [Candidatus Omnitrophota bacterium]
MGYVRRFKFKNGIDKKLIQSQIKVAIATTKCIFGHAKVKFNAGYAVSKNQALIDISSDVGKFLDQVFNRLMTEQVGKNKFTAERIKTKE